MKSFLSLLNAGFREFVRDRMAVFWTLAFPILFIVIFGLIFSDQHASAYPVGVVLEKDIGQRRPEYADYVRRTNAFFPGRQKSGGEI